MALEIINDLRCIGETNESANEMADLLITGYVDFDFYTTPDMGRFSVAFGSEEAAGRVAGYNIRRRSSRSELPPEWISTESKWE